jgi:hypothetical protein
MSCIEHADTEEFVDAEEVNGVGDLVDSDEDMFADIGEAHLVEG